MVKRHYWIEQIERQWRRRSILWLGGGCAASVLTATSVALVLRPFSSRRSNEIVAAPKVYGFDTGFVCAHRGWIDLRPDDLGHLWEHYVINELNARLQPTDLHYWCDKQGHEVDIILARRGKRLTAVECKWSVRDFNPTNLLIFARRYPRAVLLVATPDAHPSFTRTYEGVEIQFLTLDDLVASLAGG